MGEVGERVGGVGNSVVGERDGGENGESVCAGEAEGPVGLGVGAFVGADVGELVGRPVGASVGAKVGARVGEVVFST